MGAVDDVASCAIIEAMRDETNPRERERQSDHLTCAARRCRRIRAGINVNLKGCREKRRADFAAFMTTSCSRAHRRMISTSTLRTRGYCLRARHPGYAIVTQKICGIISAILCAISLSSDRKRWAPIRLVAQRSLHPRAQPHARERTRSRRDTSLRS